MKFKGNKKLFKTISYANVAWHATLGNVIKFFSFFPFGKMTKC
jgi:hypothetical protein